MSEPTTIFSIYEDKDREIRQTLTEVYDALKEKGYNPINQLVGYILSEDPTYITTYGRRAQQDPQDRPRRSACRPAEELPRRVVLLRSGSTRHSGIRCARVLFFPALPLPRGGRSKRPHNTALGPSPARYLFARAPLFLLTSSEQFFIIALMLQRGKSLLVKEWRI